MSLRKTIFWLHLIAGSIAGVVILTMSVTGVLLAFERQIVAKAEEYQITPIADATRLPMETLLGKARAATGNATPSMITLRSGTPAPVAFSFGREKNLFINPYTGESMGEGAKKTRAFFGLVTDVHRWLATSADNRAIGKAITGACNLTFLFLVVSGLYLWWPRQWSMFKSITRFNRSLSGKARDWNWHNAIGFWSALPLLIIVSTGVIMSYAWANNLLFRVTGSEAPARPSSKEGGGKDRSGVSATGLKLDHFNTMWTAAQEKVAGWKTITLRLPSSSEGPFAFTIDCGNGARPDLRSQLNFNGKTGEVVSYENYASSNTGRKLRFWARWMHTGEAVGPIGQIIAALASAGAAMLVWTGFSLVVRRFLNRKSRDVQETTVTATAINSPVK